MAPAGTRPAPPLIFPLVGKLSPPDRGYSRLVRELSSRLAAPMGCESAQDVLDLFFPVNAPIRSLERIVGDLCEDVRKFL